MRKVFRCLLISLLFIGTGCSEKNAVEGKVTITSTAPFSKLKGSKSPPPQIPKQ